jgi:hypothetical protein
VRLPARYLVTVAHWEEVMKNEVLDEATMVILASYRDSFLGLTASLKEIEAEIKARAKIDKRVRIPVIPAM